MTANLPEKRSEGEVFIAEFFTEKGICFKEQVDITTLKGDVARFRVADFYLPYYGVYVEFLGKWNSPDARAQYQQKKNVYAANKVPCIYLYPDNLGAIEWLFRNRLRAVLRDHKLRRAQFLYEIKNYFSERGFMFLVLIVFLIFAHGLGRALLVVLLLGGAVSEVVEVRRKIRTA